MIYIIIGFIVALVAFILAIILLVVFYKRAKQTREMPLTCETAEVLGVYDESHYRNPGMTLKGSVLLEGSMSTQYYQRFCAEFKTLDGRELKFRINKKWFIRLHDGDRGTLKYKNKKFISFDHII